MTKAELVDEVGREAALTRKRDHIYHAAMLDPHTAAELDPEQIVSLVDDLLAAHGDLVPPMS
jgi:alpha-galactosidase